SMASLQKLIDELRSHFTDELKRAAHSKDIEDLKIKYLGKKGSVQALMLELKACTAEERPQFGKWINDLKIEISSQCEEFLNSLKTKELNKRLKEEWIDITLPGRRDNQGHVHPITAAMHRIIDILIGMGFSVQLGPDVDTDYYNFGGLNFAADHPARDM